MVFGYKDRQRVDQTSSQNVGVLLHQIKHIRRGPDKGAQERWRHATQQIKLLEDRQTIVAFALEENYLDLLLYRDCISQTQHDAGMRLKADFLEAGLSPRCTAHYSSVGRCYASGAGSRERERTAPEEAAYTRWRAAIKSMIPPLATVVESVVCYENLPAQEKVAFLCVGLKKLVIHYGL